MIRSIITISALGFALAGCTTGEATNQAPRPVPAPAPVVAPAPAVEQSRTEQAPAFSGYTCEPTADARFDNPANPNELTNKSCGYTDTAGQERSNDPWIDDQLDQARQTQQQVQDVPMPPDTTNVDPSSPEYTEQMDTYRQQVNEYMCAEGNAYTIPSNQRSC